MKRLVLILMLLGWFASPHAQEAPDSLSGQAAADKAAGAAASETASETVSGAASETAVAERLWDRANTAYINGDYHRAVVLYEEILSRGLSSVKLYYNLANSYFKEDRLGKAILFYRRALRLAPGSETSATTCRLPRRGRRTRSNGFPSFS